ncbi:phospholipase d/transphosphatidylase [Grosmannia clavigera kw1407]|uniref:Phospholipase d/transphosphatidylase n=1 Tax=Grosmannia clavigera (strain kw1407 / UAMH 11150) TaxID=655863 RepID=F0XP50_GROCL|nr:phospholipase d/transphosphatidylase [Grosmannia clavigera kw1407]EFX00450.1 phospholipase d/transphosphatidylase [Grosmannia clavigera kw1407]
MADSFDYSLVGQLQAQPAAAWRDDLPPYDFGDAHGSAAELIVDSRLQSFRLGTGASIFVSALLPAMLVARHEIIVVTCFWAPSKSLEGLSAALARLAATRREQQRQQGPGPSSKSTLRIRICFSSRTLVQKLLHTASADGCVYPAATWSSQLGLPPATVLHEAGIDLAVKSLFFRPLSVMHPKMVLIDRHRAFLPSCNISWEPWLEGCVELTGPVIRPLLSFYARTWGDDLPPLEVLSGAVEAGDVAESAETAPSACATADTRSTTTISPLDVDGPGSIVVGFSPDAAPIHTMVLPSSHHCNPAFRPFPWQHAPPPPPTPLNLALLQLFETARKNIFVQTPNVTSQPAVTALLNVLSRGVDVDIVTGRSMMVLEQLVTSGTTTARYLRGWIRRYEALRPDTLCGKLRIWYFHPLRRASVSVERPVAVGDEEQAILPAVTATSTNESGFAVDSDEPVQSHLKLTIVDGEHTVLGSGNMDRASWFTSQELGILFHDAAVASAVRTAVDRVLDGRLEPMYPSAHAS